MPNNAIATIKQGGRVLRVSPNTGLPYDIQAADNEPERLTYRGVVYGLAPSGAVNDLIVLGGAAGKKIRLKSVAVSGAATGSANNIGIYLFKRTAAYTGGTPTAITKTACSVNDPAASATLNHYASGAPTPGAGTMFDGGRLNLAPASNGSIDRLYFQYTWQNDQAPQAESATEFLALGLNGITISTFTGNIDASFTWTEEG